MKPGVDVGLREQIRAKIAADYGEHTMLPGNKMPRPRRLPTGSLALDYVSGGGYAFNHMSRFWGAWSSGKTLAVFKAFVSAQNFGELRYAQLLALSQMSEVASELKQAKYFKDQAKREREYGSLSCLFVNTEKSLDVTHMERLGVDLSKIDIIKDESTIEGVGDIVYTSLPGYHVIGVDSTSATMSVDEVVSVKNGKSTEKTVYDNSQTTGMTRAGKWAINMDWWRARLKPDNLILMTSHATQQMTARAALGSTPEKPPGGNKLHHEPGLTLHFLKSSALKRKPNGGLEEVDGDAARGGATASAFAKFQAAGGVVVVKCDKNKVGVQGRAVVLHHDKRTGDFDPLYEYERLGAYYRVLEKSGGWYTLPNGKKTNQIRGILAQEDELRTRIQAVVLRCAEDALYESSLLTGQTEELVSLSS